MSRTSCRHIRHGAPHPRKAIGPLTELASRTATGATGGVGLAVPILHRSSATTVMRRPRPRCRPQRRRRLSISRTGIPLAARNCDGDRPADRTTGTRHSMTTCRGRPPGSTSPPVQRRSSPRQQWATGSDVVRSVRGRINLAGQRCLGQRTNVLSASDGYQESPAAGGEVQTTAVS